MPLRDAHRFRAVGLPARHREGVRDDACAGPQLLQQLGLQLVYEEGEQVDRHHGRAPEVGREDIALLERHSPGHPGTARVLARERHQPRVNLHAEAARAELLRRGDHDAAVARAEVHHEIVLAGAGEREHALDHFVRRGDEGRPLAAVLRLGGSNGHAAEQDCRQWGLHGPVCSNSIPHPAATGKKKPGRSRALMAAKDLLRGFLAFGFRLRLALFRGLFGGSGRISSIMGDMAKGIKSFKKGLSEDDEA